jgi:hypothetical protein
LSKLWYLYLLWRDATYQPRSTGGNTNANQDDELTGFEKFKKTQEAKKSDDE